MESVYTAMIYFPYGLAFFSMGLIIFYEYDRCSDPRMRFALFPLALFGLSHGFHEWVEMFQRLNLLPFQPVGNLLWPAFRIGLLAFSFLSLSTFGALTMASNERIRRLAMIGPIILVAVWGVGLLSFRGTYGLSDVAIPAAVLAAVGLIFQQHVFRKAGMSQFGRDSMWAAISFIWYGILGQIFVHESSLALSQVVNQELFQRVFQFPVQLLRAAAALAISIFVTRFLRSFEVERQNQLDMLQESRLKEAQRRETMRGELLRKVVDAQEAERKRIARELHDATGQALTALGMGIRGISSKLPEEAGEEIENLKNLESLAVKSLDELRIFISDLRPSHLDELGLRSALRWYVGDILQRVDFDISLEVPHESANLPPSISTALFRVAQEAVTNIIKHAQAKNVWIRLGYRKNGDVRLEVEDDGIGFNPNQIQMMSGPTWGLMGMQERTILCGGEFSLLTAPGEGTLVQVTIPGTEIKKVKDKNENQNLSG
ncbi:MAG: sensor histidine kinase [Anaerolineales bacterium]